jgi:restriction system protein
MIWFYEHPSRQPESVWSTTICTFCQTPLHLLHSAQDVIRHKVRGTLEKQLYVCPACGWWKVEGQRALEDVVHSMQSFSTLGAAASLRELDLTDLSTPIEEVRSYLVAKYDKRFDINPRAFEETVASVFRDLGYSAETTAYSNDDGIDAILTRGRETIGVQVKRYKNAIKVEQIRSLAGALLLGGITRGIFVTTSTFQRGAAPTTQQFRCRGYKIELMDATRFYDTLKLAQRTMYGSFEDFPIKECMDRLEQIDDTITVRWDL